MGNEKRSRWLTIIGSFLIVIGGGNLILNSEYDTTVATPEGRVHNIGKISQLQQWNTNCRVIIGVGVALIVADVIRRRRA